MANNRVYALGKQINVTPTFGAHTPIQDGDAVVVGQMPGVALTGPAADGTVPVDFAGVYNLPVHGFDGTAAAAITPGEIVYFDTGAPGLNVHTTGVRFGYALDAVASGATTTIRVKLGY